MIDWTQLDPEFMAYAADLRKRYDGKGHFLDADALSEGDAGVGDGSGECDGAAAGASADSNEPLCTSVYLKAEITVTAGDPKQADGGIPVRLEVESDGGRRWAAGWLPSCVITESEGFDENELATIVSYFESNAAGIFEKYLARRFGAREA